MRACIKNTGLLVAFLFSASVLAQGQANPEMEKANPQMEQPNTEMEPANADKGQANPEMLSASGVDQEAIKAVIWKETVSYGKGNLEAWSSCYDQGEETSATYALPTGERIVIRGFQTLRETVRQWMAESPKDGSGFKAEAQKNWDIRVSGDMAWAQFSETYKSNGENHESFEIRILHRINNQWKIVYLGFIEP